MAPANPVPLSPSVERRIGEMTRYPCHRKKPPAPIAAPVVAALPAVVRVRAPRVADNLPVVIRRQEVEPSGVSTSRLMGDPTSPRWQPAVIPPEPEEPLDRDGLWLEREIARMSGFD